MDKLENKTIDRHTMYDMSDVYKIGFEFYSQDNPHIGIGCNVVLENRDSNEIKIYEVSFGGLQDLIIKLYNKYCKDKQFVPKPDIPEETIER